MKKPVLYSLLSLLPLLGAAQGFHEVFDDITTLEGNGWTMSNQSSPVGTATWFQGNSASFSAHSGAATAYIGVNFNSTAGAGDISNWLITPSINVVDGDIVVFWTRTAAGSIWNDRVEVRSSPGAMTLPSGAAGVGSFNDLLLTINGNYDLSYPESWTRYAITISGVGSTPTAKRFAFRYNVLNGGPGGDDSNYIGIDDVFVGNPNDEGGTGPVALCTPSLDCTDGDVILSVSFAGIDNAGTCSPNGYGDFTGMVASVQAGQTYPIDVQVGDGWSSESVSVWVDWNDNNEFEQNEFTYVGTGSASVVSGNIDVPASVTPGTYRMRVRVAAVTAPGATWDMACDNSQGYGETEDYSVAVGPVGINEVAAVSVNFFPNPMNDVLHISTDGKIISLEAFTTTGQKALSIEKPNGQPVNVSSLPAGMYIFRAIMENGQAVTFKATKN
ncbi:MAG TPA: choice-of-anchor J domain-containing protein [Flavobacteriales bacterium]|nr:choice-of-anchor J domain-containing protein [Flavobacteriales bacterium]